ncbi:hypothetical protein SAMN04487968_10537 [Nocardioides terrae]|uniref:DUF6752 domain-containing protein n=1 Tax=Nocardioides terrae TaxID=574651 RepID=A0A1I1HW85_9ACTN|nr:DUF6752 domain-containing protein [Nocardioides terrae]SFC28194.1 hypothetical protein SAMN04487968_10537 [Nocardioides terrae]
MASGNAKDFARRVRGLVEDRVRGSKAYESTLRARVQRLEEELEADRQLHRKVAELSDVVAELLIPIQDRDDAKVNEVLSRYRKTI